MALRAFAQGAWASTAWADTHAWLETENAVTAETGNYILTGNAVNLNHAYRPIAEQGSYSLTGIDVSFSRSFYLEASPGSYTLEGRTLILNFTTIPPTFDNPHLRVGTGKLKIGW